VADGVVAGDGPLDVDQWRAVDVDREPQGQVPQSGTVTVGGGQEGGLVGRGGTQGGDGEQCGGVEVPDGHGHIVAIARGRERVGGQRGRHPVVEPLGVRAERARRIRRAGGEQMIE
jgi:hypothetical protein